MENLFLFLLTWSVYMPIYIVYHSPFNLFRKADNFAEFFSKKFLRGALVLAFLSVPFNFNGNVFTVMGSAKGKSVYSLFSPYQMAEVHALSIFGALHQKAGENSAVIFGAAGYQNSGKSSLVGFGAAGYQNATESADPGLLTFYQKVGEQDRLFALWSKLEAKR